MPVPKNVWMKLPKAQRGKLTYQQYVNWANKKTAARARTAASQNIGNPYFQPLTPGQLQRQATTQVQSQTIPIIKQITASINRQKSASLADLNRSINNTVSAIAPLAGQVSQTYAGAQQGMQNVNTGLANAVAAAGAAGQKNISAELGQSGLSPSQSFNLTDAGTQNAATMTGMGSTALDALLADRATNVSNLQAQPGFVRRMGAQNAASLEKQYANTLSDQIGQITGQVPGMVNSAYQNLLQREFEKATARQGFLMDQAKFTESVREANQALTAKNAKTAAAFPKISAQVSNNANDGYARDAGGHLIPDGHGGYVGWQPHSTTGSAANPKVNPRISTQHNDGHAYGDDGRPIPGVTWPKTPAGGTGGKSGVGMRQALSGAYNLGAGLRQQMITKLNPQQGIHNFKPDYDAAGQPIPGSKQKKIQQYITQQRQQAVSQMYAFWQQHFPGQSQAWIQKQVALSLAQTGWKQDAANLGFQGAQFGAPPAGPSGTGSQPGMPKGQTGEGGMMVPQAPTTPQQPKTPVIKGGKKGAEAAWADYAGKASDSVKKRYSKNLYKGYGVLVNAFLQKAFEMRVVLQPAQAQLLAQALLHLKNPKGSNLPLGDPRLYDPSYKRWRALTSG